MPEANKRALVRRACKLKRNVDVGLWVHGSHGRYASQNAEESGEAQRSMHTKIRHHSRKRVSNAG